jgi:hypothetical protein
MNWDDKQQVLDVVKTRWALHHASERLRDDPEVVLAAVRQDGLALRFASERLRDDTEVVLAAMKKMKRH